MIWGRGGVCVFCLLLLFLLLFFVDEGQCFVWATVILVGEGQCLGKGEGGYSCFSFSQHYFDR